MERSEAPGGLALDRADNPRDWGQLVTLDGFSRRDWVSRPDPICGYVSRQPCVKCQELTPTAAPARPQGVAGRRRSRRSPAAHSRGPSHDESRRQTQFAGVAPWPHRTPIKNKKQGLTPGTPGTRSDPGNPGNDPIGYAARDFNLYRYCGNRAAHAVDPSGGNYFDYVRKLYVLRCRFKSRNT